LDIDTKLTIQSDVKQLESVQIIRGGGHYGFFVRLITQVTLAAGSQLGVCLYHQPAQDHKSTGLRGHQ
jgi:hypothetical protein